MDRAPWLLIGLGNPGGSYDGTRHNVGFHVLDSLTQSYAFSPFTTKGKKSLAMGTVGDETVYALKPLSFMNLSGLPTGQIVRFYKIPLSQILVIHDDLSLTPGKARLKQGGGNAGHNGLKSIDQCIGQNYWRLRIGIGHPGAPHLVTDYVLGRFLNNDKPWIEDLTEKITQHLPLFFSGDLDTFQSRLMQPSSPPSSNT